MCHGLANESRAHTLIGMTEAGHPTPAGCALSGWANVPAAGATLAEVVIHGTKAQVHIVVEHDDDWVDCWQDEDGWHEAGSGNCRNTHWFLDDLI